MNKTQVMALLRSHKDERGIEKRRASKPAGLKHFGIGLTTLRKLGKQIGRDHELALKLWESDVYDAKALALLIDDPKKITREHPSMAAGPPPHLRHRNQVPQVLRTKFTVN